MSLANALLLPVATRRKRRFRTPLRCAAAAGWSACWARRPAASNPSSLPFVRGAAAMAAEGCVADAEAVAGSRADLARCSLLVAALASSAAAESTGSEHHARACRP